MEADDPTLIAAVAAGSERAFNTLVDRHQQSVRVFLRGLAREDADDVAQETFLAAWTQARSFRGGGSVKAWLFAIAWRKAKGAQRGWFRRRSRDAAWHEAGARGAHVSDEDRVALTQGLKELSMDQRAAVVLCLGCGFTHEEAAEALGAPLGTVKSHVSRGREKLRGLLGEGR